MSMMGRFLHRTIGLMAAVGMGLLPLPGSAPGQEQDCAVPASFYDTEPTLPKTAAAIANRQPVSIVAVGGASTLGRAAPISPGQRASPRPSPAASRPRV